MKVDKIKYIGENVWGKNQFYIGKKLLTKNKVYKLSIEWEVGLFMNNEWVFYIIDDLNDGTSRGYELHRKDIAELRELNLTLLDLNK